MTQYPPAPIRQPWLKKTRATALGFGLGATLALSPLVWAENSPSADASSSQTLGVPQQSFAPLVKNSRFVFTPAPAVEKTPPGRLTIAQSSHSSTSLRLVSTNALSFVRNSSPSSRTIAHVPPGASSARMSCRNSTWVELVSKAKFFCASLPSFPPKGGGSGAAACFYAAGLIHRPS